MPAIAILAGATGLVGRECLRLALDDYDSVIALVRKPMSTSHPKLTARQIDFERLGTIEIPSGAHVYCTLGTTIKRAGTEAAFRRVDFDYPRMLAERAAAAGNARFLIVTSVGASSRSGSFYLRVKGELEDAVRAMKLESAHFFHPSFIMGNREESRAGESAGIVLARVLAPLLVGPLRKYRPIRAAAIARAMMQAAREDRQGAFVYHYDEMLRLAGAK
ncbi:MAG TPA: NAD(P)H-binding protein [Bryobacteraceae bacterium]|nr:NAD(P)H-binding protein [Bryobacteraceae bacterium]